MVRPVKSTREQLRRALRRARKLIITSTSAKTRAYYKKFIDDFKYGIDSKSKYSKKGRYTKSRTKIHNIIIRKFLKQDKRTKSPDVYVFGGVAGSGKTSVLAKHVKEPTMTINNDDIKVELAKYDKSPVKKYKLLHAVYLHNESSDIEEKLLKLAIRGRKDIILDRTLANYEKQRGVLRNLKKKGYKITLLGTNLPPHIAILRVAKRSLKKGRWVPLTIVKQKGNKTNKSVIKMAKNKKLVSSAKVYNTRTRKGKLIYSR